MVDRVYDFFFGDQVRKHVLLISAFFLGQLSAIPLLGWLEPSQHVALAVSISFISIWPLSVLYDRFFAVRRRRTQEPIRGEVDIHNVELMMMAMHQIERMLHDMASIRNNRLPVDQTTRDIILDFVQNRTLSQKFLQDYERLRAQFVHGVPVIPGQTPSQILAESDVSSVLDNARDLLTRLHFISYANEKTIYELSANFEKIMLRNVENLREAQASAEAIGSMVANMQTYLRLIEAISNKEVEKLIEEYKRTN